MIVILVYYVGFFRFRCEIKFNCNLQLVGGAPDDNGQYHGMKTEGGSVQLLISSSDGSSITYSLDPGQAGYVEQLDNVLDTFKSQGSWMSLYLLSVNGSI